MSDKLHVKKDDVVMVVSGSEKGKKGKVLAAYPREGKVIVEGVNVAVKHKKPRGQGQLGGRINQENPIFASNAMLYCSKCEKPTRVAKKVLKDGSKVRYCKHCNETFDK